MTFIQRVKDLGFPLDQFVVIGSGLLDAYGLRPTDDINLVVSESFYGALKQKGNYEESTKHGELYLIGDKIEIWQTWGPGYEFKALFSDAVTIDGVNFVNPGLLVTKKHELGRDKDIIDIKLLEQYLHEH